MIFVVKFKAGCLQVTQLPRSKSANDRFKLSAKTNRTSAKDKSQPALKVDEEVEVCSQDEEGFERSEILIRLMNVFMPMPADLIEFVLDYSCGEPSFKKRKILP